MDLESYNRISHEHLPALASGVVFEEVAPQLLSETPANFSAKSQQIRGFNYLDGAAAYTPLGEEVLSEREMQVASLVMTGVSDIAISLYLGLGVPTIKTHSRRINAKIAELGGGDPDRHNNRAGLLHRMTESRMPLMKVLIRSSNDPVGKLWDRHVELLDLVSQGATNAECVTSLGLTLHTIQNYVSMINGRLEVTKRSMAAAQYILAKRIQLDEPSAPTIAIL